MVKLGDLNHVTSPSATNRVLRPPARFGRPAGVISDLRTASIGPAWLERPGNRVRIVFQEFAVHSSQFTASVAAATGLSYELRTEPGPLFGCIFQRTLPAKALWNFWVLVRYHLASTRKRQKHVGNEDALRKVFRF